uniref:Uncharacterized protein n=1 Tax=Chromera velia CCMP2878 TaxID=1169474 RepID=A0A0G4H8S4_9ALVE|eukprot:Cvel_25205.t1-p1 / transcript=Cvel_25205.t1 / gene=Cvel_25205 / organism=Chromera_velia_CCMP2878 / gene_product=hypothetical protein / transcript_product=hypothetical protein / location=Cvel_scaffold2824:1693-12127(+) / protein_length=1135 / sequence_SO=supercontig / SO=protein_coding / is_pseudo=false
MQIETSAWALLHAIGILCDTKDTPIPGEDFEREKDGLPQAQNRSTPVAKRGSRVASEIYLWSLSFRQSLPQVSRESTLDGMLQVISGCAKNLEAALEDTKILEQNPSTEEEEGGSERDRGVGTLQLEEFPKVVFAPFNPKRLVMETARRFMPSSLKKGIRLKVLDETKEEFCRDLQVMGDAPRLSQLLSAGIGNAMKRTDRGESLTITFSLKAPEIMLLSSREKKAKEAEGKVEDEEEEEAPAAVARLLMEVLHTGSGWSRRAGARFERAAFVTLNDSSLEDIRTEVGNGEEAQAEQEEGECIPERLLCFLDGAKKIMREHDGSVELKLKGKGEGSEFCLEARLRIPVIRMSSNLSSPTVGDQTESGHLKDSCSNPISPSKGPIVSHTSMVALRQLAGHVAVFAQVRQLQAREEKEEEEKKMALLLPGTAGSALGCLRSVSILRERDCGTDMKPQFPHTALQLQSSRMSLETTQSLLLLSLDSDVDSNAGGVLSQGSEITSQRQKGEGETERFATRIEECLQQHGIAVNKKVVGKSEALQTLSSLRDVGSLHGGREKPQVTGIGTSEAKKTEEALLSSPDSPPPAAVLILVSFRSQEDALSLLQNLLDPVRGDHARERDSTAGMINVLPPPALGPLAFSFPGSPIESPPPGSELSSSTFCTWDDARLATAARCLLAGATDVVRFPEEEVGIALLHARLVSVLGRHNRAHLTSRIASLCEEALAPVVPIASNVFSQQPTVPIGESFPIKLSAQVFFVFVDLSLLSPSFDGGNSSMADTASAVLSFTGEIFEEAGRCGMMCIDSTQDSLFFALHLREEGKKKDMGKNGQTGAPPQCRGTDLLEGTSGDRVVEFAMQTATLCKRRGAEGVRIGVHFAEVTAALWNAGPLHMTYFGDDVRVAPFLGVAADPRRLDSLEGQERERVLWRDTRGDGRGERRGGGSSRRAMVDSQAGGPVSEGASIVVSGAVLQETALLQTGEVEGRHLESQKGLLSRGMLLHPCVLPLGCVEPPGCLPLSVFALMETQLPSREASGARPAAWVGVAHASSAVAREGGFDRSSLPDCTTWADGRMERREMDSRSALQGSPPPANARSIRQMRPAADAEEEDEEEQGGGTNFEKAAFLFSRRTSFFLQGGGEE